MTGRIPGRDFQLLFIFICCSLCLVCDCHFGGKRENISEEVQFAFFLLSPLWVITSQHLNNYTWSEEKGPAWALYSVNVFYLAIYFVFEGLGEKSVFC